MDLFKVLQRECIAVRSAARDKAGILDEIARPAKASPLLEAVTAEAIRDGLADREDLGSTGFGSGIAIPHCRMPSIQEFVVGLVTAPDGARHEGQFKNDNKNAFTGDLSWTGVYNPSARIGAAYVFHTTNVEPVHFYWDRDTDGKLYFNPSLDTKTMKAGDRFTYAVSLAAYAAPTEAWKDAAAASAEAMKTRGPLE